MYQNTTIQQSNLEQAGQFLSLLFSNTADLKEIRLLPSGQQFFDHDLATILAFIANHLDENVCFGVATRKTNDGSKNGVSYVTSLWADIDWKDFAHGQAETDEAIRKFPLKPSIIVSSGHGYHLYWRLLEPTPAAIEIEGYLKGIAKALDADRAAAELARILRVPGTFNYKDKENIVPVAIREVTEVSYALSEFDPWKMEVRQIEKRHINFTGSCQNVDVRRFNLSPKIMKLITEGWCGTDYGSRSEADQATITALIAKSATHDEIQTIFRNYPIGEKYRERGTSGDNYLIHSIASAEDHIADQQKVISFNSYSHIQKPN